MRVCVSLKPSAVLRPLGLATHVGVELRLDLDDDFETPPVRCEWVATYRSREHGGEANPSDRESVGWHKRLVALERGANWIDIEADEPDISEKIQIIKAKNAKVLLSHHDLKPGNPFQHWSAEPSWLEAVDAVKVIGTGDRPEDVFAQHDAYKRWNGPPLIHFYMGNEVKATRLLALKYGAPFTFAALNDDDRVAPGQWTLDELHAMGIGSTELSKALLFAVIGSPVGHSRSPLTHGPRLACLYPELLFIPLPAEDESHLRAYVERFPELGAMAITKPMKEIAAKFADRFDKAADVCSQAVNTLVRREDQWWGANTDYMAAASLFQGYEGQTVRVLGYGGLGRVAALAALNGGLRVQVTNRSSQRVAQVLDEVEVVPWERRHEAGAEIIFQATSVGMAPSVHRSPIDHVPIGTKLVIESIYHPNRTQLVNLADAAGVKVISGNTFFEQQAGFQQSLFKAYLRELSFSNSLPNTTRQLSP